MEKREEKWNEKKGEDETVVEMDVGDCWTIMWLHVMPLDCIVINGLNDQFYVTRILQDFYKKIDTHNITV